MVTDEKRFTLKVVQTDYPDIGSHGRNLCAEVITRQDSYLLNQQVHEGQVQANNRISPVQEIKWHNLLPCHRIPKGLIQWWEREIKSCSQALLKVRRQILWAGGWTRSSSQVPSSLNCSRILCSHDGIHAHIQSSLHHPERCLPCLQQRIPSHAREAH